MDWLTSLRNRLARIIAAPPPPNERPAAIDRDLHTLDFWRDKLSGASRTIDCREMRLIGQDSEGTIISGPGRIEIRSATEIRFFLYGQAANPEQAFRKYLTAKENPYKIADQFRLFATDYQGTEWACGWTDVDFFTDHDRGWPITGELQSLLTSASGPWVSSRSGVELLLTPPIELPMTEVLRTETRIGDEKILTSSRQGRHRVAVMGTTVTFAYEPSGEALWITAETSDDLVHPYLENWLTEPLRILLGEPVYPRMVARNFGDGTAQVWIRPSPRHKQRSPIGLLQPFSTERGRREEFWTLYEQILTFIAKAGDFDPNAITRLYEELGDAHLGSRWVLTLTLASGAEALATGLMTEADRRSEFAEESLKAMKAHLKNFKGDAALRGRMLSNLGLVSKRSVVAYMRELAGQSHLAGDEVQTWYEIRNAVMHGEMVEPWSSEESDTRLMLMLSLFHKLTRLTVSGRHHPEASGAGAPANPDTPA